MFSVSGSFLGPYLVEYRSSSTAPPPHPLPSFQLLWPRKQNGMEGIGNILNIDWLKDVMHQLFGETEKRFIFEMKYVALYVL